MKKEFFLRLSVKDRCTLWFMVKKAFVLEVDSGGSCLPAVRICSLGVCSLKTSLLLCVNLISA